MAERSLAATPHGLTIATNALTGLGISKDDLTAKVEIQGKKTTTGISIATVKKFFAGQKVDRKYFVGICNALKLDWEDIAGLKSAPVPDETIEPETDIDALVQTIRAQVHGDIQARCGTMRVLDMEQPIGLGDIYTSVNILEKLSGRQRLGLDELLQDCDPENFDRFLLGQVRHKRVPGLEAVERYDHLMILGKPGAGKTTFMKWLAILCNQGEFQPQRVPVFVTLKDYAEAEGKLKLQTYIQGQWNTCGVETADAILTVLGNGKALVLLDGLDEVKETDHNRVLQDIKTFAHQFRTCPCVITCRIAAREYIFEQFTEVEVADFDQKQIAEFAAKWFMVRDDYQKSEVFIQHLENNESIRELAITPILLTLLCLIFEETSRFPINRSDLYQEGTDLLLKKWDEQRGIKRDLIYKRLSLLCKKDLLSQIAFETFERGDYFFRQTTVEQHIIRYIRNLSGASDDRDALQLDGEAVLKSIEAQHGLLTERARGIYSFSHLTFQEYFTAQYIISSKVNLNLALQNLATHIAEKRYREIFLLTVGMLSEADTLLGLMKQHIDHLMAEEPAQEDKLQALLTWVQQRASTVEATYKPVEIRAACCDRSIAIALECDCDFQSVLDRDLEVTLEFALELDYINELDGKLDSGRNLELAIDSTIQSAVSDPELKIKIQSLRAELPSRDDGEAFGQWCLANGKAWAERLRAVMIEHRNIGHDWQFTEAQEDRLRQYTEANVLLVNCLKSDCYVTKATRQYIEDTLLLPLSEIGKYPVPDAIVTP